MEIKVGMAMEEMVVMGGLGISHMNGSLRMEVLLGKIKMEEIGAKAPVTGAM